MNTSNSKRLTVLVLTLLLFAPRLAFAQAGAFLGGANNAVPAAPIVIGPASGTSGIATNTSVQWSASGATSCDVKFGTDNPPATTVSAAQACSTYSPGALSNTTTYYWRIIARNANGTVTGTVWSFTTASAAAAPGTPSTPSPADTTLDRPLTPTLTWLSSGATTYDVNFGTSSNPPSVTSGQAAASYSPATLTASTVYYWKITAHNATGATVGPIWSFTTGGPPAAPALTSPANAATNVATSATLTWTAGSLPTDTYDVFFDTVNPPLIAVATRQAGLSFSPTLIAGQTYYWYIRPYNGFGVGTPSATRSFSTLAGGPQTPTVIFPSDKATNVSLTPTITCSAVGATSFDIDLDTNIAFPAPQHLVVGVPTCQSGSAAATVGAPVQQQTAVWSAGTSIPVTLTFTPTPGNLLVAEYSSTNGGTDNPVLSITQAGGVTWTNADHLSVLSRNAEIWYAANVPSGASATITVNLTGNCVASATRCDVRISEWAIPSATLNTTAPNNGSDTSPNTAITPTAARNALLVALMRGQTVSAGPTNGWTALLATSNTDSAGAYLAVNGTAGSYPVGWTQATGNWALVSAAFLPPAASGALSLVNNQLYYIRVTAHNAGGTSQTITSFTTVTAAPGTPTVTFPTDGATNIVTSPTITCASSGASTYNLWMDTSNPPTTQRLTNSSVCSFAASGLSNSTTYYVKVAGINSGGTTTMATPTSFTTASAGGGAFAYDAISNTTTYTKPAIVAGGPIDMTAAGHGAGYKFIDPTFSTSVLRVTDASTQAGNLNRSYTVPSNARIQDWNADSTKFYVRTIDGTFLPYTFTAATQTASRVTVAGSPITLTSTVVEPAFSRINPDVVYVAGGASGLVIRKYTFSTGMYSDVFDLTSLSLRTNIAGTYIHTLMTAGDSTEYMMAVFGGGTSDADPYAIWFNINTPATRHVVDTIGNTIDGVAISGGVTIGYTLHNADIDKTTRYVLLDREGSTHPFNCALGIAPFYLWDTTTGVVTPITYRPCGHQVLGYGTMVNQDATGVSGDNLVWQYRQLTNTATSQALAAARTGTTEGDIDDHTSWNNAQSGSSLPVLSSTARYCWQGTAPQNTAPWKPWTDEIIAIDTANAGTPGTGTVWRFAHTRNDYRDDRDTIGDCDASHNSTLPFWYTPTANISPDGQWAIFGSNWEKTLGTDADTSDPARTKRMDVFLVHLSRATAQGNLFHWASNAHLMGVFRTAGGSLASVQTVDVNGAKTGTVWGNTALFIGGPTATYGMAFYPTNKSLYIPCTIQNQYGPYVPDYITEIAVPTISGNGGYTALGNPANAYASWPVTNVLTDGACHDPSEGKMATVNNQSAGSHVHISGMYIDPVANDLKFTEYVYYDSPPQGSPCGPIACQKSFLYKRPLSLTATGSVSGPVTVPFPLSTSANLTDYTRWENGFIVGIPSAWQAALHGTAMLGVIQKGIISGTSYGPAAVATDLTQWNNYPSSDNTPTTGCGLNCGVPLVYYPNTNLLIDQNGHGGYGTECQGPGYVQTTVCPGTQSYSFDMVTEPNGAAMLPNIGSLLYFQRTSGGTATIDPNTGQWQGGTCYGMGVQQNPPGAPAIDNHNCVEQSPISNSTAPHAQIYKNYVLQYDANDLAAVASGTPPWSIKPYEYVDLNLPQSSGDLTKWDNMIWGVTTDSSPTCSGLKDFNGNGVSGKAGCLYIWTGGDPALGHGYIIYAYALDVP